jgi:hypothetical protein
MALLKVDGLPLNEYSLVTPGEVMGMILFHKRGLKVE